MKFSRCLRESLTPTQWSEPLPSLKLCFEVSQNANFGGGLTIDQRCHVWTLLTDSLESNVGLILPCSSVGILDRDNGDFTILDKVLVEIEGSDIRGEVVNIDVDEGVGPPVGV